MVLICGKSKMKENLVEAVKTWTDGEMANVVIDAALHLKLLKYVLI